MAGITDKEVRALIAKAEREGIDLTQADGVIPGLNLKASKSGSGSWHFRYYVGPKQKRIVIGQYPAWGIADAREHAKELRRNVDRGSDVAVDKRLAKQKAIQELTVDQLSVDYFAKASKELAKHTYDQRQSLHNRLVSPHIGSLPAASIEPSSVVDVIRRSTSNGASIPRILLVHLTQLFSHAIATGVRPFNPCRDLKESAIVGKAESSRVRVALNAAELSAFLPLLKTIPRHFELAIRLMLLTGVRVGTLSEAKLSEFDFDACTWSVPHARRKNRRYTAGPFVIPLPAEAVSWVKELAKLSDGAESLFPSRGRRDSNGRNPRAKTTVIGDWLDRLHAAHGGVWRRITPHDLRSTCKSWLSELRVDYETRQRYLDHALEGMDAIYDKADYLDRRRLVACQWLKFLTDAESGSLAGKVVFINPEQAANVASQ